MIPQGPHSSVIDDTVNHALPIVGVGWLAGRLWFQRKSALLLASGHEVIHEAFPASPNTPSDGGVPPGMARSDSW